MDKLAFGFWGVYFGTAGLMLAGSALAFALSLHRISLNAGLSATASSFFVVAFLGGLPIDDEDTLARVLAHIAMLVSGFLAYLLFSILGLLDSRKARPADPAGAPGGKTPVKVGGSQHQPRCGAARKRADALAG
jgi:predicted Na+-dependent transporter